MRSWPARFSLLGRFTVMGIVVVAALGLAIGLVLKKQIERRALNRTVASAHVIAKVGIQPTLTEEDLRYPISLARTSSDSRSTRSRSTARSSRA